MQHPRFCDACGRDARYVMADQVDDHCEECAQKRGHEMNGQACTAFATIGFAVQIARHALVTDDQLREAFEAILTKPHSEGYYPIGGDHVLGPDCAMDRPWMRVVSGEVNS